MLKFGSFLVLVCAIQTVAAQPDDNSSVLNEIEVFYSGYLSAFSKQQPEKLANTYLLTPLLFRNSGDTIFLRNKEEVVARYNALFTDLSTQNYVRSEVLASNFCVLTDTSAIVSVAFRRFDSEDKIILESGGTYAIVKVDDYWKIALITTHDAENVVSCSNSSD
ncbi:MAG: hypothetical protein ACI9UU_003010 [Candidatus Azotimanducaceae bacterium]|jgi:hypothetical protein